MLTTTTLKRTFAALSLTAGVILSAPLFGQSGRVRWNLERELGVERRHVRQRHQLRPHRP